MVVLNDNVAKQTYREYISNFYFYSSKESSLDILNGMYTNVATDVEVSLYYKGIRSPYVEWYTDFQMEKNQLLYTRASQAILLIGSIFCFYFLMYSYLLLKEKELLVKKIFGRSMLKQLLKPFLLWLVIQLSIASIFMLFVFNSFEMLPTLMLFLGSECLTFYFVYLYMNGRQNYAKVLKYKD